MVTFIQGNSERGIGPATTENLTRVTYFSNSTLRNIQHYTNVVTKATALVKLMASDTTLTELFSVLKRNDYSRECHKLPRNQGTNLHKKINNIRGTKCSVP